MSFLDQSTFSSLDDIQLIGLARGGDYNALTALLFRYVPLCKARTAFYSSNYGPEYDDLYQESMLGLFGAFRAFKGGGSRFPAFARLCIDRALISSIRSAGCKNATALPLENLPDKMPLQIASPAMEDPQDIVIAREEYRCLKNRLRDELSALEYSILCRYLSGESYDLIADRLHISVKSVDNALQRVRRKFK